MHGFLLSDDLIFSSRITGTARAHGGTLTVFRDAEKMFESAGANPLVIILDLHNGTLDLPVFLAKLREDFLTIPKVIAYGSHVDAGRLRDARTAGCDLVLARSAFVNRLEKDLPKWLTSRM